MHPPRWTPSILVATALAIYPLAACKFPYPADVADDDVGADDASGTDGARDAPSDAPLDAALDAAPVPLITNFQAADLVVGQADFTSPDPTPLDARRLFFSNGIAVTESSLWSLDLQGRALQFSPLPAAHLPAAILVIGSPVFTNTPMPATVNNNQFSFTDYCGLAATDSKLLISDSSRNRVMVWASAPATNGAAATFALGQPDLASSLTGNTSTRLRYPAGIWTNGTKLVIADTNNNRVLIWNQFPASGQVPADIVLGQPGFGVGSAPAAASASRLKGPRCVYSDGTGLYVADAGHNRVLIWSSWPTTNGADADVVVGQSTFVTSTAGTSSSQLSNPQGMVVAAGALFIVDGSNHRVLEYDPKPAMNGASATHALGQASPDEIDPGAAVSGSTLSFPTAIAARAQSLWVADSNRHRVLRFRLGRP